MVGVIPPQPGEQRIISATAALSANDDDDDDYGNYDASISSSSKNKHSVVSSEQVDIVDNYCDSEDELSKTVLIAATSFASVKREPPFVKKEVTFSTVVDDCGDSAGAGTSDNDNDNDNGVDVDVDVDDVDVDDDVGDNDDDNISKENLLNRNGATSSTATKKTVHRLPITPTALISAASASASSSTTTVVVKQQAKTNDNYTQSSSIPPPPSNGLDRQQAGLVRPNPGAYAITHPDFHQENNDNNNNNNDSSTSESETETGSTTTIEPPPLLTATTTATTMVTTDTDQILYDRYENNNPTIQNEDGNNDDKGEGETSLIEAELVKPTIFALEVSPIDEVAIKKRKKKIQISIFVGFIVVVIICVLSTVLYDKRKGRTNQEKFKDEHGYECFDSTGELNLAQVSDFITTNYTETKHTYVICPNTTIHIGDQEEEGVMNGDGPLFILNSNTTVQCDDTYSKDNDTPCVINGGWFQVAMGEYVARIEDWMVWFRNEGKDLVLTEEDVKVFYHSLSMQRYDNVTVRGLTFTGNLVNGRNTFGQSIMVKRTGNILLDECIWKDMTAPTGVILVAATSKDSPFNNNIVTKLSSRITIRNSQFTNIEYNHQLIGVYNQILVLKNTTFENIRIDHYSPPCSGRYGNVESELIDDKNDTDCLYFLACVGDARCDIQDCCQTNLDASDDEFSYDDNNSNENDEWLYKSKTATVRIDDQSKECGFD